MQTVPATLQLLTSHGTPKPLHFSVDAVQAADTRNYFAKQIYGCGFTHKEEGFSNDDLRAIGFLEHEVDDANRLSTLAEVTSTGAVHDIALAITAGKDPDGQAFGIPGAGPVPFVSPLGLFKMLLQIVSTVMCGSDPARECCSLSAAFHALKL